MPNEAILDEMDLPLSNPNEELETISKNYFRPLFDVTKFEIRDEHLRDKGVDLHVEIKKSNKHTNFRFVVQLKATDSINRNNDGSISLQLDTSNINYLLNSDIPAFYVLYAKSSNDFFYENLNEFINALSKKDINWQVQKSHVLRFKKKLIDNGISEMYNTTLQRGLFQREINERLALQTASINSGNKILFDGNLNVSDDNEIRQLIETIGLDLVNEQKWKEIILVHKNASGNVATTSKYNLVLGIANYYSGNLIEALSFLKSATKLKSELNEDLKNHLLFFETTVKYSIGIISHDEFERKMRDLENTENVGLYIRLENAKKIYAHSFTDDKYDQYVKEVTEIMSNSNATEGIKLNGRCELILFEGYKNNMDYVRGVGMINALEAELGPSLKLRVDAVHKFIESNKSWYKKLNDLKEDASKSKNYFVYFNTVINEVRVTYEMIVFSDLIAIEQEIPGVPAPEIPDKKETLERSLEKINKSFTYYNAIGHIENIVAALSIKYEILHYLDDFDIAKKVLIEMENLINTYELIEQKTRLDKLKNNGTTHEHFKIWKDEIFKEADDQKKEFDEKRDDMMRMDEEERQINIDTKDRLHIHLFPIGYFHFPKNQTEQVYRILNIQNQETKEIYKQMFEQDIIPIANIYNNPIREEGYADGKVSDKGIESWRNIYKIRKAFYENEFYRDETI